MTTDVELLPLSNFALSPLKYNDRLREYARACVAHATAAKDAEIEALRKKLAEYQVAESVAFSKQRVAEARTERLAEALRGLRELMLERVRWEPCDCGCPQQRKPDGPHSVTWLRAAQQVEIAISKAQEDAMTDKIEPLRYFR